jgi:polyhydroxyalkanoate synthesis repressor PhaR
MTTTGTILIKKYENRRLYDATNSRYVNLDEVAQFVKLGHEVRVIDAASGEDITRLILTQIIAEGAKTPDSTFPLDVLRQMIMASGRASREGAMRYITAMSDLYQNTFKAMSPALNPFDFMHAQGVGDSGQNGDQSGGASGGGGRSSKEVEQLKHRLAELEKLVSSFGSKAEPVPQGKARKATRRRSAARKGEKEPKKIKKT